MPAPRFSQDHHIDSMHSFEDVLKVYEKVITSRAIGKLGVGLLLFENPGRLIRHDNPPAFIFVFVLALLAHRTCSDIVNPFGGIFRRRGMHRDSTTMG
ncbi:hypothetical protein BDM02DRAFT_2091745 [Thelephora ganbajun]|uniref:Uncharacterized protein n=1 Tax=Thelephora ganbajun TaxID=370292 RepID=A0ACB6YZ42_THEGA|nr:hypothetical protein BDM02DRAFT_2091745 [Thelephora ganbajun]